MGSDLYVTGAQFTGYNADPAFGGRVFDPQQVLGQQFAKTSVNLTDSFGSDRTTAAQTATVNPLLDGDVRPGFILQVALAGILTVVVHERPFDVNGMRIVSLDKIGVIAVHSANQIGKRGEQGRGQTATKAGGLLAKLKRQVGERRPLRGAIAEQHWFHQRDGLAPVSRFYVRFHDRLIR